MRSSKQWHILHLSVSLWTQWTQTVLEDYRLSQWVFSPVSSRGCFAVNLLWRSPLWSQWADMMACERGTCQTGERVMKCPSLPAERHSSYVPSHVYNCISAWQLPVSNTALQRAAGKVMREWQDGLCIIPSLRGNPKVTRDGPVTMETSVCGM